MTPRRRLPWRDFAGICPDCEPDENGSFNFAHCHGCLTPYIQAVDEARACPTCRQVTDRRSCAWNQICNDHSRPFGRLYAIGYRQRGNLLYKLTYNIKFLGRAGNRLPLAVLLAGHLRDNRESFGDYDITIPVPRRPEKAAAHGDPVVEIYDTARSFLGNLAEEGLVKIMLPPEQNPLSKTRRTERSPKMDFHEKRRIAHEIRDGQTPNPYTVNDAPSTLEGKAVLLFDDIFTSGYHTMYPASLALVEAGARVVDGLVLARQKFADAE